MTAKEIIAGMNQLNGRKALILDFVSSDIMNNILKINFDSFLIKTREIFVRLPRYA
tara:strand:+ start:99 stop:266 length:168 start_codon:yes stop_codon:yes gene_type:complete